MSCLYFTNSDMSLYTYRGHVTLNEPRAIPSSCNKFHNSGVRRRTAEYLQIAENFATQHRTQQQSKRPIIMTPEQVFNRI